MVRQPLGMRGRGGHVAGEERTNGEIRGSEPGRYDRPGAGAAPVQVRGAAAIALGELDPGDGAGELESGKVIRMLDGVVRLVRVRGTILRQQAGGGGNRKKKREPETSHRRWLNELSGKLT